MAIGTVSGTGSLAANSTSLSNASSSKNSHFEAILAQQMKTNLQQIFLDEICHRQLDPISTSGLADAIQQDASQNQRQLQSQTLASLSISLMA